MTHDVAQHLHMPDPPRQGLNHPCALRSPWSDTAITERVTELWADHSATQISEKIWEEYRVNITRSAVIGKLKRLGLTSEAKTELHPHARNLGQAGTRLTSRKRRAPRQYISPQVPQEPLNLTLIEVPPNGCRYIAGDDLLYCGHPQHEGSSYCPAHHAIVWVRPLRGEARAAR